MVRACGWAWTGLGARGGARRVGRGAERGSPVLSGLSAGATYLYRVGDPILITGLSGWMNFTMPPAPTTDSLPFTFALTADTGATDAAVKVVDLINRSPAQVQEGGGAWGARSDDSSPQEASCCTLVHTPTHPHGHYARCTTPPQMVMHIGDHAYSDIFLPDGNFNADLFAPGSSKASSCVRCWAAAAGRGGVWKKSVTFSGTRRC